MQKSPEIRLVKESVGPRVILFTFLHEASLLPSLLSDVSNSEDKNVNPQVCGLFKCIHNITCSERWLGGLRQVVLSAPLGLGSDEGGGRKNCTELVEGGSH